MNVRFFAGTRQQYDSLPTPRNPLGLYFCADTNELFWADRLLTDGMRVVDRFTDLPEPLSAADGVVYYVTETRNGYVVPHGTDKWLQTIYAPALDVTKVPESEIYNTVTTVGAVRDIAAEIYGEVDALEKRVANIELVGTPGSGVTSIYFSGYKLENVDGNFVIDRRCALEALGFVLPDGIEGEKVEIVTKEYVDSLIKAVTGTDLSEYAKKSDLTGLASEDFVRAQIEAIPEANLGEYAKKSDLAGLASEDFVRTQIEAIPEVNLSEYAKKSEVPSIEGLATEEFVRSEIAKAELNGGEVTDEELANLLAGYYTKTEVDKKIGSINIPSTEGLATEEFVSEAIAKIEIPKVPTKVSELENDLGYLTAHQDLGHLVTRDELQDAIDNIEHPTVDLTGYVTNEYIQNQNYVTNSYIEQNYITSEQIAATYVTEEQVSETITNEVNTVVTEQIETKVTEVIQEKIDAGELNVKVNSISYGTF